LPRPRYRIAWIWPVLLAAVVLSVVVFRVWSGWATRPMMASADGSEGLVGGSGGDPAAAVARARRLRAEAEAIRRRLAALAAEAVARRDEIRTLDRMLSTGPLTECPPFLRDEAGVTALQKVLREAAGATQAGDDERTRLHTAAAVARERLRARLAALRNDRLHQVSDLEREVASLRQELHLLSPNLPRP
jgi:hypothetical protein